ncbi:chromatin structure-remodeling complex subunit snf21-like protein [Achlya hypogyna]|uniref:Chromatin structure-remodeling complex subunit snf21-like protein n=1 Tax=Achlya hypogyna TaxID=1202772 RepID=A0A1V9ZMU7_ACHHY|nr:chromatin structure-remodeling complex subunit snf21-like protein [Achlya hypogyna]
MESSTDLRQLMAMAVRMREEGRTSDPRYHQIVTVLRAHQQRVADARAEAKTGKAKAAPTTTRTEPKPLIFTEKQLTHLHQQIRTFKALSRTMDELLATDVTAAPAPILTTPPPTPDIAKAIQFPEIVDIKRPQTNHACTWRRGDSELVYVPPAGLDSFVVRGLQDPASTPTSGLHRLQAQLREQMVLAYHVQLAALGDPVHVDRTYFKRKRPALALYDPSERERRMKSLSNEKKRRAARSVFLRSVLHHAREFQAFHKARVSSLAKVSRSAKAQVDAKANRAEREEDRQEKLRLKALKANDMAAYSKLVAEAKNERLTYLLSQTNTYLDSIRELVRGHREKHGIVAPAASADGDDELDYLGIAVNSEMPRQPQMLVGGDLKEYQLRGLQWMVSLYDNRLNGILADEMGLGKTIQSISLVTYIMEFKHNHGPFLVVVPLSTLSNWVNEFRKWAPDITLVVYKGSIGAGQAGIDVYGHPQARKDIYRLEMASVQFNVLLTTYEYIMKDKHVLRKYDWQYIIVDEGHRMKNAQSKFAMTLGSLYTSRNRLLLTGTPLQNSLPELWALLNFLLPTIFESVDNFEQWFSKPFSHFTGSGETNELSDEERMLIINRLHQVLRPFLLRRVKSSVLDQLPDKVERVIRCELSGWQKIMYRRIQEGGSLLMEASDEKDKAKAFTAKGLSNILMQLRKVCNHPYLFQSQGYPIDFDIVRSSGKFELLDRMLPKLHAAGHRVLMFSQMTQLMHVLEDYFNYRGFRYLRLDGSTSADEREQRMFMFNAADSPYFIFLLSTRAGGLGLNLATADTVIIFDSDWNPAMDAQAQDRAHRIGQKNEVRVFRLITNSPIEEKILSRATEKMNMNNLVVEAGKFHAKSKEADRRAMLESLIKMESEDAADEAMVMDNDELNSIMALTDEELAQYHRLDQQRVLREAKLFGSPFNRLMGIADVPPWLQAAEAAEVQQRAAPEDGPFLVDDVKRKRKEISYRDMSEAQFHRILEDGGGDGDNVMAKKPKLADDGVPVTEERLRQVYDAVLRAKDGTGRLRHFLFLEKPSATDYPDYYTIVTTPMDLKTIDARIAAGAYATFDALEADFRLMFENAQRYNPKESLVHHDAVEMAKVMKTKLRAVKGLTSAKKSAKKGRR